MKMPTSQYPLMFALMMAGTACAWAGEPVVRIPASGGEILLPTARSVQMHETYRFAAARRVGDTLYVSGVVIALREGEGTDVEAFKAQTRRGFERLRDTLAAAGATFADVAMINSFHVWDSPHFAGTRDAHFEAFSSVLGEFMAPPYAAWTAVGTTGLLGERGIVEIQLIVHLPARAGSLIPPRS